MSEVAGLLVLTSNYECADIIDNEVETRVVTKAVIGPTEINKLQELGWELAGPSVAVFKKIRGDGPSPIVDEVFESEDDTTEFPVVNDEE